jgi:parallel beta-helix repeat protein
MLWGASLVATPSPRLPTIVVATNHTVISQSCRVEISPGTVFEDPEGLGAIQIGADNIEIEFAKDSVLRGSPPGVSPDHYKGCGVRLNGHSGVTIRGARINGFWVGLWATKADGLALERIDASDNRRARLKSTPAAEDESDWLYGHDNDHKEWLSKYGAAVYIEQSARVTVHDCRVWHGQNGLCLDRVAESKIYDNDFSFNSGWGIALWRSSQNIISRNAVDFCVRGYSHGVYNRGQDSAGIFVFEQNNKNVFAENSATHGGDGFFGFAGKEAIAETGEHPVEWYKRRGNSDNILIRNDFSYAVAHGIENTFSFGNRYLENRIVGNAICGIWAGYSRETLIEGNDFQANGEMGYGLERGGVNIDHGGDNIIVSNRFSTNQCGVHLWGGANLDFEKKNWAKANGYASTGSVIVGNSFLGDSLAFQFRGPGEVTLGSNYLVGVAREILTDPAYTVRRNEHQTISTQDPVVPALFGVTHPVGARAQLRGRQNIVMTEWGPWDHLEPLVRLLSARGGMAIYEVLQVPATNLQANVVGSDVVAIVAPGSEVLNEAKITLGTPQPGVHPYVLKVTAAGAPLAELSGTLLSAKWQTTFFKWPTNADPRQNLEAYHKLALGPTAVSELLDELSFKYGMRGPSDLGISEKITAARLGRDHFGMIARTKILLPQGQWEFATQSDDGVRVAVDGKPVIDNWTWHGPTRDASTVTIEKERTVEIVVEHFQIDGYAVLEFTLAPKTAAASVDRQPIEGFPIH